MAPKRSRPSSSQVAPFEWEEASWESDVGSAQEERGSGSEWGSEQEDEADPGQVAGNEAEEELVNFLLHQHRTGKMSAKNLCITAFWAGKAGLKQLQALGMHPLAPSGNYKRHLDAFLRKREERGEPAQGDYVVPIPSFHRSSGERRLHNLICRPPHEIVDAEMAGQDVTSLLQSWPAPPGFAQHPVVRAMEAQGKATVPLALYVDAVQYATKDSMLVFTVTNLLTEAKHVVAVLRKRLTCGVKTACGCRRWCSLWPIWQFIRWSLEALATATYPVSRHCPPLDSPAAQESGWRPEDAARSRKAGQELCVAGAVIQVRADWGEMTARFGVANWSTASNPCFLCRCSRANMYDRELLHQRAMPWPARDHADYETACGACEIEVQTGRLSEKKWKELKGSLEMDSRKDASKGRGFFLNRAWPEYGLKKGDRFEPSPSVPDYALLSERQPESMTFWRRSKETSVRHRNPVFSASLGTDLPTAFTVDTMHTWCLGLHAQYVAAALWAVVDTAMFHSPVPQGNASREDHHHKAMLALRQELTAWYKQLARKQPETIVTKVHDLSLEHIGSMNKPELKCKAHETLGLLMFLEAKMPAWKVNLEHGEAWADAAKYLLRLWTLLEASPTVIPQNTQEAGIDFRVGLTRLHSARLSGKIGKNVSRPEHLARRARASRRVACRPVRMALRRRC